MTTSNSSDKIASLGLDRQFDWIGSMDAIGKIRPIRIKRPVDESSIERLYRVRIESLNRYNLYFWRQHNALFDRERIEYIDLIKANNADATVTADQMAVFYQAFLERRADALADYNR
jgi:hypothetical protein